MRIINKIEEIRKPPNQKKMGTYNSPVCTHFHPLSRTPAKVLRQVTKTTAKGQADAVL
jgi:hypothetical protein